MEICGKQEESSRLLITRTFSWVIPINQQLDKGTGFPLTSEDSCPERPPSISEVTNDDPEVKQEIVACSTTVKTSPIPRVCLCTVVSKFSSWNQAKRIIAWILRYRVKLLEARDKRKTGKKLAFQNPHNPESLRLQVNELENAEREIIKCLQACSFPDEVAVLKPREDKDPQHERTVPSVKEVVLFLN